MWRRTVSQYVVDVVESQGGEKAEDLACLARNCKREKHPQRIVELITGMEYNTSHVTHIFSSHDSQIRPIETRCES